jgi:hypothetical protein
MSVLNTAIEELQWLPYARRINKRRTEISTTGGSEAQGLLRDNTKALANISQQLGRLDNIAPVLSSIAGRMANIETLLKRIADTMESGKPDIEGGVSKRARER